jgi:hypothetical protein
MNKSLAVFLISDKVRMVKVAYETDAKGAPLEGKTYSFKTFDDTIKLDDLVVVPTGTRVGFTVVRVIDVDVQDDLDFSLDDGVAYKWIAGKFNRTLYDEGVAKEKTLLDAVANAEKNKKREELRKALLENVSDDQKTLLLGAGPSAAS